MKTIILMLAVVALTSTAFAARSDNFLESIETEDLGIIIGEHIQAPSFSSYEFRSEGSRIYWKGVGEREEKELDWIDVGAEIIDIMYVYECPELILGTVKGSTTLIFDGSEEMWYLTKNYNCSNPYRCTVKDFKGEK